MVSKIRTSTDVIDCACVIHGDVYSWQYVENLYNMLQRHLSRPMRFHVYTESNRAVPSNMIKHELQECPAANERKRGWWYKMQLFNKEYFAGDLLYLDLDTVVVRDLTWITDLPTHKLWAVRDFRFLQDTDSYEINSSVMWWNVEKFHWLWEKFANSDPYQEVKKHNGDQDYIDSNLAPNQRAYFPESSMTSWRWQAQQHNADAIIPSTTSVLIFHGSPKPHEVTDPQIVTLWC